MASACSNLGQGSGHAAKAKIASMGTLPRLGHATKVGVAFMGMQPRPRQPLWAHSLGQKPPMSMLPSPGHTTEAKAGLINGQAAKGRAEALHRHMASGKHWGVSLQTEWGKKF